MSKLLLSTSLVVALMASGAALYADEPADTVAEIQANPDQGEVKEEQANLQETVDSLGDLSGKEAKDVQAIADDSQKLSSAETLLSTNDKEAVEEQVDAVNKAHDELVQKVADAIAAKSLDEQVAAYEEVEDAMGFLEKNANVLSEKLETLKDAGAVAAEEQVEALVKDTGTADTKLNEANLATQESDLDAKDESKAQAAAIDEDSKIQVNQQLIEAVERANGEDLEKTKTAINDSITKAEAIKDDLETQGASTTGSTSSDEQLIKVKAALKNLFDILNEIGLSAKKGSAAHTTKK